ncbi:MAG: putative ATP-dependent RNA helicase dbp2 [Streblomastix strix]|uniref:RNA helicase n=1 Tax=Streblomastix strix TaxID=222440 RepID=A0A5J4UY92_9EUKA|nr:MAG: putative ATP-dependent RNA helicase dbp2 [Streblomastix strix]
MTEKEVQEFQERLSITISGSNTPRPCCSFKQAGFPKYLQLTLDSMHFTDPTPIQCACWPSILQGRDVIGLAQTGSGKTLAYALPSLIHINAQDVVKPGEGPIVLILAPTRELALQIQTEINRFGLSSQLKTSAIYGGVPKGPQVIELAKGVETVVGTPGRLIDLLVDEPPKFRLDRVTYLVLDEADRMLDFGFEPQIRAILTQIRPDRQTLLFSATWPRNVQDLASTLLRSDVIRISVGTAETSAQAADTVKQNFLFCTEGERIKTFFDFIGRYLCAEDIRNQKKRRRSDTQTAQDHSSDHIEEEENQSQDEQDKIRRILVFAETKRDVDELAYECRMRLRINVLALHGDKMQEDRERIMERFKQGGRIDLDVIKQNITKAKKRNRNINREGDGKGYKGYKGDRKVGNDEQDDIYDDGISGCPILIATDVASRGLDVKNIECVVNYQFPFAIEDYVHRIGRTGRAGVQGESFTLFTPKDAKFAPDLLSLLRKVNQPIPKDLEIYAQIADKQSGIKQR